MNFRKENMSEIKEVYTVKVRKSCKGYFIHSDLNNQNEPIIYIKPNTAILFRAIDKQHSHSICNSMMNFIYAAKRNQKSYKSTDTKNMGNVDTDGIYGYLYEQMKILSDADRKIIDDRLKYLRSIFVKEEDITHTIRQVFEPDFNDEMTISDILFSNEFDDREIYDNASLDLSEIGELTSKYSFEQLYFYDIEKEELDNICEKVYTFVNIYGLLGILTRIFTITPSLYLTNVDIDSANVETFIAEVINSIETNPMLAAEYSRRYGFMNLYEYIKLFFPDKTLMRYYDEYRFMDSRFWVKYSEPLNLFLIAARAFFEECKIIDGTGSKPCVSFDNINIKYEHNEKTDSYVFRMEFCSFFDAIRYNAMYSSMKNHSDLLLCKNCHRLFYKGEQRSRKFCSTKCGSKFRKDKFNKKKQKDASE